jgi:signal transduction histidine kinase
MNAADAMELVNDRERILTIKSLAENGKVIITVADSGVGIASEDIDHIFDAFFTTKRSGMGIGLSICQSIIESHGGRLWVTSNMPFGSIFQLELLATRPGAAATA